MAPFNPSDSAEGLNFDSEFNQGTAVVHDHTYTFSEIVNELIHPHSHTNGTGLGSSSDSPGGFEHVAVPALVVPLAFAVIAILLVALIIRRMRRSESMREMRQIDITPSSAFPNPTLAVSDLNLDMKKGTEIEMIEIPSHQQKVKKTSMKRLRVFSSRVIHVINFPKKIRQHAAEKKRFNIYAIPLETREQLKQIYVY